MPRASEAVKQAQRYTCRNNQKMVRHAQTTRPAQRLWQASTHAAKASTGHRSMHASREPPGHPLGLGDGDGDGVGVGDGDGVGPAVVEPIGPNLMSENFTLESACPC